MKANCLPSNRLFFWMLCILSFLSACTETEQALADDPERPEKMIQAEAWADSMLNQLSDQALAAQLIWQGFEFQADSQALASSIAEIQQYQPAGLVLLKGNIDSVAVQLPSLLPAFQLRPLIALDLNAQTLADNDWPSLLAVGGMASDSLAHAWGRSLGMATRYFGGRYCFVAAGKVGRKGEWMKDALGTEPEAVSKLSLALIDGMEELNVRPILRPSLDRADFGPSSTDALPKLEGELQELSPQYAAPLKTLVESHPRIGLQMGQIEIPAIMPGQAMAYHERSYSLFLQKGLHHQGLVFSPKGAEFAAISAGADIWVAPNMPLEQSIQQVLDSLPKASLQSKARKVLVHRAMQGLHRPPVNQGLELDPKPPIRHLHRYISKHNLVILRDKKQRLPLGQSLAIGQVATLALGISSKNDLQVALDAHGPVDHFLYNGKMDSLNLVQQANRLKKYEYLVLSLHSSLVKDSSNGHLPKALVNWLLELDKKQKIVVMNFAGRNSLQGLSELSCLGFCPEDKELDANIAGQAIAGAIALSSQLPDDLSAEFPAGTGVRILKRTRCEYTSPEELGLSTYASFRIDSLLENAIRLGVFPGCQVFAAKDGKVFLNKSYGYHDYSRRRRVKNSDLYDIASVSKIAATTLMAMYAFEADTLRLDQPLKHFMQDLDSNFISIRDLTPQQLMIHAAGLPSGIDLGPYYKAMRQPDSIRTKIYSKRPDSIFTVRIAEDLYLNEHYRDSLWDRVKRIPLAQPGNYVYSDLSMYIMKELLERVLSTHIEKFVDSVIYRPMGLRRIGYSPLGRFERDEIVPTEDDRYWRKQVLQGDVHDPTVAFLGGVGGPAGIFSNASELGTLMQMLLNGGSYGGVKFFDPQTVAMFTARQPDSHRALGFDMQWPSPVEKKGYCCISAPPSTYGHFGFTGTCAWVDPQNKVVYVFLSNRVYPSASNSKINAYRIRQTLQQYIYDGLGLGLAPLNGFIADEYSCYYED